MIRRSILAALLVAGLTASETTDDHWLPHAHPATHRRVLYSYTEPVQQMQLATEVAGRIDRLALDRGDRVPAGEAVIGIDQLPAELRLQAAEARLATAERQVVEAQTAVASAERSARFAEDEHQRLVALAEQEQVAQRQLDEASYQADLSRLQQELAASRVAAAEAAVAEAQVAVAQARDLLQRHRITGPSGWLVTERLAQPESVVAAGTPILHLVDTSRLQCRFLLTEAEIAALRAQGTATLTFVDLAGQPATPAELHRIDPLHDPVTNKRLVECRLSGDAAPEASGGLRVGLELILPDPGDLISIPDRFVDRDLERFRVRSDSGTWLSITPLRRIDGQTLISAKDLPADVRLRLPGKTDTTVEEPTASTAQPNAGAQP